MKHVVIAILCLFLIFLLVQIYTLRGKIRDAEGEYANAAQRLNAAKTENKALRSDLDYYSNPDNLEKEVRSRFNYRKPDEKMIILVPSAPSSTP